MWQGRNNSIQCWFAFQKTTLIIRDITTENIWLAPLYYNFLSFWKLYGSSYFICQQSGHNMSIPTKRYQYLWQIRLEMRSIVHSVYFIQQGGGNGCRTFHISRNWRECKGLFTASSLDSHIDAIVNTWMEYIGFYCIIHATSQHQYQQH